MANILVVDDSYFMRKMLSDALAGAGHNIVGEAENAKEAIELYKLLKPDLVTLDVIMPEVEGMNAADAIREMKVLDSRANVVMISSMGQSALVKEYLQAGAKDFLIKPFNPDDVAKMVDAVLSVA